MATETTKLLVPSEKSGIPPIAAVQTASAANNSTGDIESQNDEEQPLEMRSGGLTETVWEKVSIGAAAIVVPLAVYGFFVGNGINDVIAVAAAGGTTAVAVQQQKITELGSLREVSQRLKQETDQLHAETEVMKKEIDKLEETEKKLKETEEVLSDIADQQGSNIENFTKLVKDNRQILNKIAENLEATILHQIFDSVFSSDKDGDFELDPEEDEELCIRLGALSGVIFHKELFMEKLEKKGRSLNTILEIAENVLNKQIPADQKVFTFEKPRR